MVEIELPPLRERREDILYLTAAFIKEFARRFEKPVAGLSAGAERLLHNTPWPGNVRELRNVFERACMLSEGRLLSEREVLAALHGPSPASAGSPDEPDERAQDGVPELDRATIEQVLQQVGRNRAAAARLLGISRRVLYRRLDMFGLR
ncbi:MAG: hypothetical protein HYY76_04450 [Acidobacteria bacterium]|nr:hypothetical protein [Acidobacteriota bacterium]